MEVEDEIVENKWLAWLEKQGEQNLIMAKSPQLGEQKVMDSSQTCKMETLMNLDEAIEHCKKKSCDDTACGKEHKQLAEWLTELKDYRGSVAQEAQKPVDKVEPKFHEGEWITNGDYTWKIVEVKPLDYILQSQDGNIVDDTIFHVDEQFHSFTIEDAKDGDVLAYKNENTEWILIYKNIITESCDVPHDVLKYHALFTGTVFYDSGCAGMISENYALCFTPATKEQRDTLFAKMKEAGYSFDFEKKELKKLGQPEVTKTSDQEEIAEIPFGAKDSELQEAIYNIPKGFHAEIDYDKVVIKKGEKLIEWSEEDEHRVKDTIYFLDTAKKHYASTVELEACIDWLKSLKQRIGE